jgi:predicted house-cleaning noncanonical NTP pyrophosphatase (MazG superfamily)
MAPPLEDEIVDAFLSHPDYKRTNHSDRESLILMVRNKLESLRKHPRKDDQNPYGLPKLIRDNAALNGWPRQPTPRLRIAEGFERTQFLKEKLHEEMDEFLEAVAGREFGPEHVVEEAADVLEVLLALVRDSKINAPLESVLTALYDKRQRRGGFTLGVIAEPVPKTG